MRVVLLIVLVAGCGGSDVSRMLGARCGDSSDCDERCLLEADGWPGGMCTISCDTHDDCPGGTACVADEGACVYACGDDLDCEFLGAGWGCIARPGRPDGEVMVCHGQ